MTETRRAAVNRARLPRRSLHAPDGTSHEVACRHSGVCNVSPVAMVHGGFDWLPPALTWGRAQEPETEAPMVSHKAAVHCLGARSLGTRTGPGRHANSGSLPPGRDRIAPETMGTPMAAGDACSRHGCDNRAAAERCTGATWYYCPSRSSSMGPEKGIGRTVRRHTAETYRTVPVSRFPCYWWCLEGPVRPALLVGHRLVHHAAAAMHMLRCSSEQVWEIRGHLPLWAALTCTSHCRFRANDGGKARVDGTKRYCQPEMTWDSAPRETSHKACKQVVRGTKVLGGGPRTSKRRGA